MERGKKAGERERAREKKEVKELSFQSISENKKMYVVRVRRKDVESFTSSTCRNFVQRRV